MSGESSRASEKCKGSTYLQMACSYLLVFLLPVLVSSALIYYIFMEHVNEQAMQLTIDDARMAEEACERQVQQAVDFFGALLGNDRLGDSFEPSDFEQVRLLKIQLKALDVSTNNGACTAGATAFCIPAARRTRSPAFSPPIRSKAFATRRPFRRCSTRCAWPAQGCCG